MLTQQQKKVSSSLSAYMTRWKSLSIENYSKSNKLTGNTYTHPQNHLRDYPDELAIHEQVNYHYSRKNSWQKNSTEATTTKKLRKQACLTASENDVIHLACPILK